MQGRFNTLRSLNAIQHINRSKEKKTQYYLNRCRKSLQQNQYSFMIKALMILGIEGMYVNIIKDIYYKPIANIILNREKLKPFSLMSGRRK
jgi:hypothetical protein